MQFVACPHCGMQLQNDPQLAGQSVACPSCTGHFQMPVQTIPVAQAFTVPGPYAVHNMVPSGITVPLLISAIGNIVIGLFWISTFLRNSRNSDACPIYL